MARRLRRTFVSEARRARHGSRRGTSRRRRRRRPSALALVDWSAGAPSAERIDVEPPAAGTYKLYVHGWQTDGRECCLHVFSWLVPSMAAGNMTATSSRATATVGGTADVTAAWSGLTARTKYLGRIGYTDGSGEIGSTIVTVEP